jgi:uncharacterized protein YdhG (YjbR/CyaY superfamily)
MEHMVNKNVYKNIDEYIANFPKQVQEKLQEMRETIRAAAPQAIEKISYQMPAFDLKGTLVYFAGWKNHIGFYAMPSGNEKFREEISRYQNAKGSVKFPLSEPLPLELVTIIVKFRVAENLEKARLKSSKNK